MLVCAQRQRYRSQFEAHVALMKRQQLVQIWQDRKILADDDWAGDIDLHLDTADIETLFISADFLSSNYWYERETKRALERHKKDKLPVVPILVGLAIGKMLRSPACTQFRLIIDPSLHGKTEMRNGRKSQTI